MAKHGPTDPPTGAAAAPGSILVVCTGNICRSPIAAALLRERLTGDAAGLPAEIVSAGTLAEVGTAVDSSARAEAEALGIDIADHRARPLTAADVEAASLVIGMEREHRTLAVTSVPAAGRRSFTLRELVRVLEALVERRRQDGSPPVGSLAEVVAAAADLRGLLPPLRPADLDVPDPYRRSPAVHRKVARMIDDQVGRVVAALDDLLGGAAAAR